MSPIKLYLICLLVVVFSACVSNTVNKSNSTEPQHEEPKAEQTTSQRIYYLQHRLISGWVFESEGAFFFDLYHGQTEKFIDAVGEVVSPDYASKMVVTPAPDREAVSIRFPEPESMANCYFVLILHGETGFSYYTYEKTMSFGEESVVGVVGSWTEDGTHHNHGARSYVSEDEFIKDILGTE